MMLAEYQTSRAVREHEAAGWKRRRRQYRSARRQVDALLGRDKSWQVYLTFLAAVITFAVLFVRWWTI